MRTLREVRAVRATCVSRMRARAVVVICAAASLASCATTGTGAGGGVSVGSGASTNRSFGRADERQRIGSFASVQSVAVSRRFVYAATGGGIAIYDRLAESWMPPLTRDEGFFDQQITVMAGDPVEDALWIGVPGGVVIYRPQTQQLQRTIITGVPDVIAFDRSGSGDAFVRAGGAWTRVSRVGMTLPSSGPPPANSLVLPRGLDAVYQQFPALRSQSALMFRTQQSDRPLRNANIVSGAASPERASEVWLGTNGDGLFRVDPTFQQATSLPFGLIAPGAGALAPSADGVWVAGLGVPSIRSGLTLASLDLQRWRWIEGTINVPLIGMRTYGLVTRADRAWMATDRGVVRVKLDRSEAMVAWTTLDGLPDDRVYAVAARDDGAWVGTARGAAYITDSSDARNPRTRGIGARVLENTPVYALQFTGDTLWMGTEGGLLALPTPSGVTGGSLSRPLGVDPALRRPVRALAWSDTVLLAATDDAVLALAPRGGREPQRIDVLDTRLVGQVTRLAIDERTMWLAGTDGLVMTVRGTNAVRVLRVGVDLPGPALDVLLTRDWLWVATPQGLMRFRRASDGGLL